MTMPMLIFIIVSIMCVGVVVFAVALCKASAKPVPVPVPPGKYKGTVTKVEPSGLTIKKITKVKEELDKAKMEQDVMTYGICASIDGKRIDPKDLYDN